MSSRKIYKKEQCVICSFLKSCHINLPQLNTVLFCFPTEPTATEWREAITSKLPKVFIGRNALVCSLHFSRADVTYNKSRKMLKPTAVPRVKEYYEYLNDDIEECWNAGQVVINDDTQCVICTNFETFDRMNNAASEKRSFFKFPKDSVGETAWLTAITSEDPSLDIDVTDALVCSLHFLRSSFEDRKCSVLSSKAVPEIFKSTETWSIESEMAPQTTVKVPVEKKVADKRCRVTKTKEKIFSQPKSNDQPDKSKSFNSDCVICLGLQGYYTDANDWRMNDVPRSLVSFPTNKAMRTLWAKAILTKFPFTKIMTPSICTLHFLESDMTSEGQVLWHAVPVIPVFPPQPEADVVVVDEEEDYSKWLTPDTIQFEMVQLIPDTEEIGSLNAVFEEAKTFSFLFTKPSTKLVRLTPISAIEAQRLDFQIMEEYERLVDATQMEHLLKLNNRYLGDVPDDSEPPVTPMCRLCLAQKTLISIFEPAGSKLDASKTIADWVSVFYQTVQITPDDKLSPKVCLDCQIEVLYAINLRVRAVETDTSLRIMLHSENFDDEEDDGLIEMMPMCRICMNDTDLQTIDEALKAGIEIIIGFEVELDNRMPNFICIGDVNKVQTTLRFLETVQEVDNILRSVWRRKVDARDLFPIAPNVEEVADNEVLVETVNNDPIVKEPVDQVLSCDKCDIQPFTSPHALDDHKRTAHIINVPQQCKHCSEVFASAYKLKVHILSLHYEGEAYHACETCQRTFKHSFLLADHSRRCQLANAMKTQKLDPQWACKRCSFKTFWEPVYKAHVETHDNRFICNECGQSYGRKDKLKKHLLMKHATEKDMGKECQVCGTILLQTDSWTTHCKTRQHRAAEDALMADEQFGAIELVL